MLNCVVVIEECYIGVLGLMATFSVFLCTFVCASLYMCREENQLDATK